MKAFVKNEMNIESKERLYKVLIGMDAWRIEKELLTQAKYESERDGALAAYFMQDYLSEPSMDTPINHELIKKYSDPVLHLDEKNRFIRNAIKAMDKFPEQLQQILTQTGEAELDPKKMVYMGSHIYRYANMFIISFENSPAAAEVRYI